MHNTQSDLNVCVCFLIMSCSYQLTGSQTRQTTQPSLHELLPYQHYTRLTHKHICAYENKNYSANIELWYFPLIYWIIQIWIKFKLYILAMNGCVNLTKTCPGQHLSHFKMQKEKLFWIKKCQFCMSIWTNIFFFHWYFSWQYFSTPSPKFSLP